MKFSKRFISAVMAVLIVVTSFTAVTVFSADAAVKAPTVIVNKASNVTCNNAYISAKVSNPGKATVKKAGCQIGTVKGKYTTEIIENVPAKYQRNINSISYDLKNNKVKKLH